MSINTSNEVLVIGLEFGAHLFLFSYCIYLFISVSLPFFLPGIANPKRGVKSAQELKKKSNIDKLKENGKIILVHMKKAYDLTNWKHLHPGGSLVLENLAGTDCTDQILVYHPVGVIDKYLKYFYIGDVEYKKQEENSMMNISLTPISVSFRKLNDELINEGLYTTHLSYYYIQLLKLLVLFTAVVSLIVYNRNKNWLPIVLAAVILAVFWQQLAFIVHDSGHNSITHNSAIDNVVGVTLGNLFSGISIGWWKHSHNVHHIVTNDPEKDPDVQHLPMFAISEDFLHNIYSTYHKRILAIDSVAKFLLRHQHLTYYAVLMMGRLNLYVLSFQFLLLNKNNKHWMYELFCLCLFWCWFVYLLSHVGSCAQIVSFVLVSHALTFILHIQINLSHYSMEIVNSFKHSEPFILQQLRTTKDIECPQWLDWFHGGLQFQAIHHLFPRIPRHNLRRVQGKVMKLCKDWGIKYETISFVEGNLVILNKLKSVASSPLLL